MAVTIGELGENAGAVVDEVARSGRRTVVTDHGRPVVAIVPIEDSSRAQNDLIKLYGGKGAFADLRRPNRSIVDEFLAERREEAAKEDMK